MSATIEQAFLQATAQKAVNGCGLPYSIMTVSPCRHCERIDEPKTEGECLSCKLIGNIEQSISTFKTRQPTVNGIRAETIKRRTTAWRNRYGTEPPDEYLYQPPQPRKKITGECDMDGCDKDACRRVLDMKFCFSHASTARGRIERGETTLEEITCKPKQSPYIQVVRK